MTKRRTRRVVPPKPTLAERDHDRRVAGWSLAAGVVLIALAVGGAWWALG